MLCGVPGGWAWARGPSAAPGGSVPSRPLGPGAVRPRVLKAAHPGGHPGDVWGGGFLCPFSPPHPLHRVPVGPSAPPGSALQSSARVMCSRTVPHKAPRIPGPAPAPCPRRTGARPPRAAPAHLSCSEPPARRSYGRS